MRNMAKRTMTQGIRLLLIEVLWRRCISVEDPADTPMNITHHHYGDIELCWSSQNYLGIALILQIAIYNQSLYLW